MRKGIKIASGKRDQEGTVVSEYKKRKRHNPVEWWDEDCRLAIQKRAEKLEVFEREKDLASYIEFKKARAEVRKVIRLKKRESFVKFAQSINRNQGMTYVWKKMEVFKNYKNRVEWNTWQGKDGEKAIVQEIGKLSPPWAQIKKINVPLAEEIREDGLDKEFTMAELERALRNVKDKSAPGLDNIEYRMLKGLTK